ncbi:hypothetical protein PoB_005686900 [Plakobranchus ocellatus]|uniref:Uncharacterized protein n=1 Tax=Plakobranchus ocellatus TaxID=259542 RepID=A0AAV4CCP8_9GAST|nr:hypothetical protein PoB_005686900 [Plakobranchus ocellatus]
MKVPRACANEGWHEDKVSAIKNMPTLRNKQELMEFLGTISYLRKVISANPQQDDLRLSIPPLSQDACGGARTCERRVPKDLRADPLSTVPLTDLLHTALRQQSLNITDAARSEPSPKSEDHSVWTRDRNSC